jgi:hypothetical protein
MDGQIINYKLDGTCGEYGQDEKYVNDFGGKTERQRRLDRQKVRWENHYIMDLKELGRKGVNWIDLAQDKNKRRCAVNTVMNHRSQ